MPRLFVWLLCACVSSAVVVDAACVTTTTVPAPAPPPPAAPPLWEPFYSQLGPHGDWWWSERWGWVFSPAVEVGWRPYLHGHWLFTDDGWVWESAEPFAWACYHYGHWVFLDDAGWTWIPGRTWSPSVVEWRRGPGVIGWAPLAPPGVVVVDFGWVFVADAAFLAPDIVVVVWPVEHNHRGLERSHVLHRGRDEHRDRGDDRDDRRGEGPDRDDIARVTGVAVTPDVDARLRARKVERFERLDVAGTEARPLRAPAEADVERYYDERRRQSDARHRDEQQRPPADVAPDELQRRQRVEREAVRDEEAKERAALKKKKELPRKTPVKPPVKTPLPAKKKPLPAKEQP